MKEEVSITRYGNIGALYRGELCTGILHMTRYHMIFSSSEPFREIWIGYPLIEKVEKKGFYESKTSLYIYCRDFRFVTFYFYSEYDAQAIYEAIQKYTYMVCIRDSYAFVYTPRKAEALFNGWELYQPIKEFERQGVGIRTKEWRITNVNKNYTLCSTYPSVLVVPSKISDSVIRYASKFRSKGRFPALTYIHSSNNCSITRSSQPMVGIKQKRSLQDEYLISAIFETTSSHDASKTTKSYRLSMGNNLVVDARPTANAMVNVAVGAGTENMENYKGAKKVYLGIDNIHVMRDSLERVMEALKNSNMVSLPPDPSLLMKSNWIKYLAIILEGTVFIARAIHIDYSHVLIHCSDGWDRTSQLSSLAQLCLDPYYRTLEGFMVLIEKDWLSFGYRFSSRLGHLFNRKGFSTSESSSFSSKSVTNYFVRQMFSSMQSKFMEISKHYRSKDISPIFHQFLDCTYQILHQFSDRFEFNERFLRKLFHHTYSCQYGSFLYNNEKERIAANVHENTRSVWDYFLSRKEKFLNNNYNPSLDHGSLSIIFPDTTAIVWWSSIFGRSENEMNIFPSL
ncbi:hypothetical protein T552_00130 [Pneumocystis carinii B80]|uniref:Myotubularin phosphatase domain-containing protein n=1 Tax=Pneumocystis carinii (strain B80) TaxID=1408658 RepID=A0A0W4ZSZ5_PNEC8|nr:hypothetical protein T552_00130 [Pneumocystis carinii B80]KTW31487.1 hypothetical protein T552_00130 [Pneumocystis carinii B80]